MRTCARCRQMLPDGEFYPRAGRPTGTRRSHCIACDRAWHREYRWMRKYGVTPEQYASMLAGQGGVCAICKSSDEGRGHAFLHVDHNHRTGEIRGLLCAYCNIRASYLGDDNELVQRTIVYLRGEVVEGTAVDRVAVEAVSLAGVR